MYNNLKFTLILVQFLCFTVVKNDYCDSRYVLRDFPPDIVKDLIVGANGADPEFNGCSHIEEVDSENIGLWHNGAENKVDPIRLDHNNSNQIDLSKPLVILIHGWLCNVTSNLFPEVTDAYLSRYTNRNVIRVEWTKYATDRYANSYCYIPKIAETLGKFLCRMNSTFGLDLDETHVVGHSMGAQIAGLTGKEVKKQCHHKLKRITGLDPARPIFQHVNTSERLHRTDAKIVDVIHTNQRQLGFHGSIGTVDFYPNCGFFQPNSYKLTNHTRIEELHPLPLGVILRSHILAVEYFLESIVSGKFVATSCANCKIPNCVEDADATTTIMGEHYSQHKGTANNYLVTTNGFKPYIRDYAPNEI